VKVRTVLFAAAARVFVRGLCATQRLRSRSHVEFDDFSLVAPGLVFELHPTESPILVRATAEKCLKVCQVGTSFAGPGGALIRS
jgi:hypothetical protein